MAIGSGKTSGGLVTRSCPGCATTSGRVRWEKGTLRVVCCDRCQIFYANPVELELASGAFYDRLGVPFYLSPAKLESDYSPVRFRRELSFFRRWCSDGHVLDVGCSTGGFLYQLGQWDGYEGVGMDVAGPALEYAASKGVSIIREPFLEHDFGNQRFDAVTFWAVVEHLTDPLPFLRKAASLLTPQGLCFVLVPNRGSLATRILGAKYRYVMPDHVNYFSRRTLRAFIERVPELQVVGGTTMHFNPIVILQDLRRTDDRVPDAERAALLKKTTAWKESPWALPLQWGYRVMEYGLNALGLGDNVVLVARKR